MIDFGRGIVGTRCPHDGLGQDVPATDWDKMSQPQWGQDVPGTGSGGAFLDEAADGLGDEVDLGGGEAGVGAEEEGLVHDAVGVWKR